MTEKKRNGSLTNIAGLVDTKLEDEGEWFEHAPMDGTMERNHVPGFRSLVLDENGTGLIRVCVRSRFTDDYKTAQDKVLSKAVRIPVEGRFRFNEREGIKLLATKCLKDWEFTDRTGAHIPFSKDTALDLLLNPACRNHAAFVEAAVNRLQETTAGVLEEDAGN